MLSIHRAIDCTHIAISEPPTFSEDYYYFKTGDYLMVAQVVVNCQKIFRSVLLICSEM